MVLKRVDPTLTLPPPVFCWIGSEGNTRTNTLCFFGRGGHLVELFTPTMLDMDRKSNIVKESLPSNIRSPGTLKVNPVHVQRGRGVYLKFNKILFKKEEVNMTRIFV